MTKVNTKPVVATSNPEIYVNHTFHMQMAKKFTYNYAGLDDYILEHYMTKTRKEIASDLHEYENRVIYRITVLQEVGLIGNKRVGRTNAGRAKKEYLQSWNKTNELYKALMALDDKALAG